MPPPKVFVSYRRDDTAAYAGRLYDRLSDAFGESNVFMDVDSIAPGDDFVESINSAVGACTLLLALVGRDWVGSGEPAGRRRIDDPSDYVRLEIETALDRHIRVVPVLVDGAAVPESSELPYSLRPLARRQAGYLSHSQFRSDVAALVATIEGLAAGGSTDFERPGGEPPSRERLREMSLPSTWNVVVESRSYFSFTLLATRKERHVITYKNAAKQDGGQHVVVDGKVVGSCQSFTFKEQWEFVMVDEGRPFKALLGIKGNLLTSRVKWSQLRIFDERGEGSWEYRPD